MICTDGITETLDGRGQELGRQGLWEIARSVPVQSPATTGEALLACVRAYAHGVPPHDDETLLVLQRLGGALEGPYRRNNGAEDCKAGGFGRTKMPTTLSGGCVPSAGEPSQRFEMHIPQGPR